MNARRGARGPYSGGEQPSMHKTRDANEAMLQLKAILSAPCSAGGFGGSLRYSDVRQVLNGLGCQWNLDRIDDCWYDIVRGCPTPVVEDVAWAAQCLYNHLQSECVEIDTNKFLQLRLAGYSSAKPVTKDRREDGRINALLPPPAPRTHAVVDMTVPELLTSPPRDEDRLMERGASQTELPDSNVFGAVEHGQSSTRGRYGSMSVGRFASPTLSSAQRSLFGQNESTRAKGTLSSPNKRRSSSPPHPPELNSGDVFSRLMDDAKNRRDRSLSSSSAEGARGSGSVSPQRQASPRVPSPLRGHWEQPTRSSLAKHSAESSPPDRLDYAAATPPVKRRAPHGPSSFVPTGYVEAVARLRKYAAIRAQRRSFAETLRTELTVSPRESEAEVVVTNDAPILRLPVKLGAGAGGKENGDGQKGRTVIDVRLVTPQRSRCANMLRGVPYDDPSRVLIQNVLRERRLL
ncbi:hypothetical protein ERJ75_001768800 [Trypanosoma vivax]|uniref:Uncharacterized protein n=1 Tax=Trypanosoma vivax (strain Y486) TaxID=1055687 RepID=G0TRK2_TRYVY|nr:hypothetical protein ERJ75_001768800 [Trypanosoma vivax]CCC46568.1 conserved hypothetical protein [Trypanosoma vivax Y486]